MAFWWLPSVSKLTSVGSKWISSSFLVVTWIAIYFFTFAFSLYFCCLGILLVNLSSSRECWKKPQLSVSLAAWCGEWQHAGSHSAGAIAERFHLTYKPETEKERQLGISSDFETPKPAPSDTLHPQTPLSPNLSQNCFNNWGSTIQIYGPMEFIFFCTTTVALIMVSYNCNRKVIKTVPYPYTHKLNLQWKSSYIYCHFPIMFISVSICLWMYLNIYMYQYLLHT